MKNSPSINFFFKVLWFTVIVAAILCSAGLFITSHKSMKLQGPQAGTVTSDGEFVLLTGNQIFKLTKTGKLIERIPTEQAQVGYAPVDIATLPSGGVLIGDPGRGNIQRCSNTLDDCKPIIKIKPGHAKPLSKQYQFHYEAKSQRIFIIFPEDNEMAIYGLDGHWLATFTDIGLAYPQDIYVEGNRVFVANTDRAEIVEYVLHNGFNLAKENTYSLENDVANPGHKYPWRIQRDLIGNWWILLANEAYTHRDLVKFDPQFFAKGRIRLDSDASPKGIAISDDTIVALDPYKYRALKVSMKGEFLDDFAGANAWDQFARYFELYQENARTRLMVWCAIALTLSGFAICIYILMVKRMALEPDTILPGVTWYKPEQKYIEFLPKLFWLFVAGFVAGVLWLLWMFGLSEGTVLVLFGNMLLYVFPGLLFMYMLQVAIHGQIGIGDDKFLIANHLGETSVGVANEAEYDGSTIVMQKRAITVKITGLGLVYDKELYHRLIAPVLEGCNRPSWINIEAKLLRIFHPPTIITFSITLPFGILALLVYFANS